MGNSPRQLAIYIALVVGALTALILLFSRLIPGGSFLLLVTGAFILTSLLTYLISYKVVNSFIVEKINPIYKTMEAYPSTKGELRKRLEGKDMIQEVNKLVVNWDRNRKSEIKKLQRMEKYRKEFLGNVSHELKTPIFNIQGYILTLLDGALEDNDINRDYLERTEKSINRMITIIEDLESITKLETGELKLQMENLDIIRLVREVFEMQDTNTKKYGIRLKFDRSYDPPIMVNADRKRITEVLNNLIVNSIYYGKKGGHTIISFAEMGDHILVDISDNGIGIEEKDIPRIFERFYRTDKSRSRDRGGTGLGLAIVKHIIEAHNQTITVRSAPGKGSSFSFSLKRA